MVQILYLYTFIKATKILQYVWAHQRILMLFLSGKFLPKIYTLSNLQHHARNFCISSWCVRSDTLGSYNCGNALTHTYIYMYVICRNSKFALAMARRKLYIRFPQSWNENVTMLASQPARKAIFFRGMMEIDPDALLYVYLCYYYLHKNLACYSIMH